VGPALPPEMIEGVLDDVDYVLLHSVNPVYSGQEFIPSSLQKLAALAEMIRSRNDAVTITVDGGIKPESVAELAQLGATDFVSGGSIFYHRPAVARVREFREAMP